MSEERKKILAMLQEGKINLEEADRLLAACSSPEEPGAPEKSAANYLRILVEPGPNSEDKDRVNIRVPMKLIRAGLKWAAFIPKSAHSSVNQALREKGIDLDFAKIAPEDIEELVSQLNDLTIDIEGKEKVRIFCE